MHMPHPCSRTCYTVPCTCHICALALATLVPCTCHTLAPALATFVPSTFRPPLYKWVS
ncbi:hypothetical protein M405DRAFT_825607 [Rhizopogon salebrosus TDB-379]|nr:hypothetical protein M405DRAFT_825607 [Rhizopogon salebrosus TDB-379]